MVRVTQVDFQSPIRKWWNADCIIFQSRRFSWDLKHRWMSVCVCVIKSGPISMIHFVEKIRVEYISGVHGRMCVVGAVCEESDNDYMLLVFITSHFNIRWIWFSEQTVQSSKNQEPDNFRKLQIRWTLLETSRFPSISILSANLTLKQWFFLTFDYNIFGFSNLFSFFFRFRTFRRKQLNTLCVLCVS